MLIHSWRLLVYIKKAVFSEVLHFKLECLQLFFVVHKFGVLFGTIFFEPIYKFLIVYFVYVFELEQSYETLLVQFLTHLRFFHSSYKQMIWIDLYFVFFYNNVNVQILLQYIHTTAPLNLTERIVDLKIRETLQFANFHSDQFEVIRNCVISWL